ncbi:hypothetical protein BV25DRAFT_1874084 [Artomyces pyxidatus]|uniref:Uncharacterized protein n=1 Tax=Artomyces pyxidatus TaxID=48021 RepID=A0ACB8TKA2_9AGAM|nr:hypothetical protein BV25DRAFT_1874084 [Artomyces pyxidatus]
MPSVRVRRKHAYSSLRDDERPNLAPPQNRRRSLSEILAPSGSASNGQDTLRPVAPPRHGKVSHSVRQSSYSYRTPSQASDDAPISPASAPRTLQEEVIYEGLATDVAVPQELHAPGHVGRPRRLSHVHDALTSHTSRGSDDEYDDDDSDTESFHDPEEHHDNDVVEHLDVIDPQVATVSALANTANAIMMPPLSFYSRKPVVVLPATRRRDVETDSTGTTSTDELDRHVEDVLNRKQNIRRILKGVWAFLKTRMSSLVLFGIYGFMIVFWGSGIVLFALKIINLHNKTNQDFWSEICQQIECGLFCITGIGLIPWRTIDTYRMYKIWKYKKLTRKLRAKAGLPELYDIDDLPDPMFDPHYVHVLDDKDQADLHHQQKEFAKSQTWYRPHGTETHRAFPINWALLICALNDGNSIFQIGLASCMWAMNRFVRPAWTTIVLIFFAFGCGIGSGVLIWQGGKKTKRTERVEAALRKALELDDKAAVAKVRSREEGSTETARDVDARIEEKDAEPSLPTPGIQIEEEMVVPPRG